MPVVDSLPVVLCDDVEELEFFPCFECLPLVVELLLPVVLCPMEPLLVLLGELIWSLPVVVWPVALVLVWPVDDAPTEFAEVGEVGSVVVPAVAGGVLDGMLDGDDDCAYANAPPARTVLSAIELIVRNFVELIGVSLFGV